MKIKKANGFVGIDMAVALVAIMAFSGLIISLMYNNYLSNVKLKKTALATIYLTEIFENVGIASYDYVTQENVDEFIPNTLEENNYQVKITVDTNLNISETQNEDIVKKVTAVISYSINNKEYQYTMERLKIKE